MPKDKLTGAAKRSAAQAAMLAKTKGEHSPTITEEPKQAPSKQDAVAADVHGLPAIDRDVPIIDSPGKTPSRSIMVDRDTQHIMKFPDGHEYMLNMKESVRSDLIVRTTSGALVRMTQVDKPTKVQQKEAAAKEERKAWRKAANKSTKSSQSNDAPEEDDTMASKKKSTKKASKAKTSSKKKSTTKKGEGTRVSQYSGKKLYKLVKENPRRAGSHSATMWDKLRDGMTWDAFIALGAKPIDVRHDINKRRLAARDS